MSYTLPVKSSSERLSYIIHTEPLSIAGQFFPHGLLSVTIRHTHEESMASVLAGTVGNAAGYGTDEAAVRVGRSAAAAVRKGISHAFTGTYGGPDVTLKWQQYNETTYCGGPRIEFGGGGDFAAVSRAMDFLRWLARKADKAAFADGNNVEWAVRHTLANPTVVTAGLDRVGAVRLMGWRERNDLIGDGGAFSIADNIARVAFASDARDGVVAA